MLLIHPAERAERPQLPRAAKAIRNRESRGEDQGVKKSDNLHNPRRSLSPHAYDNFQLFGAHTKRKPCFKKDPSLLLGGLSSIKPL